MLAELTRGPTRLLVLSLAAFGLSTVLGREAAIVTILIGLAAVLAVSLRSETVDADEGSFTPRLIFGVLILFAVFSIAGPAHVVVGSPPAWVFPVAGAVWLVLGLAWLAWRESAMARRVLFGLVLVATASLGAIHLGGAEGVGFDVAVLHERAADAIAEGASPYSDAVTVPNGAPDGAEFIVGYPYPPVTALAYSAGTWVFGDARWTSLLAWIVVLAVIGARSLRREDGQIALGAMLVAAAMPGWPLVLTTGWTESLSLALIALAVLAWARPALSGSLTGLFLGSKQYLLAAAPLLAVDRVGQRLRRSIWAGGALALSFVPVLIWGVPDFVDAAIRFHIDAPARPDGTSLVGWLDVFGVTWSPPLWLMVVGVLGLTVWIGRRVTGVQAWLAATGAILSTALILSAQAFPNYWFLIAGIAALGVSVAGRAGAEAADEQPADHVRV